MKSNFDKLDKSIRLVTVWAYLLGIYTGYLLSIPSVVCGAAETGDQVGKQAAEPQKIKYHEREPEHHVDNAQHCTRSRGGALAPAA